MASFGQLLLTNKGRALLVKAQAGALLNFTRIAIGDGSLSGQAIGELNALISEKKSIPITQRKPLKLGEYLIGGTLNNQNLATGFYYREIGIFAQDPDLGEILYSYANAGSTADYIPAGGSGDVVEQSINLISVVGNAANVSAVINESFVFASKEELDSHIGAADPHPQYTTQAEATAAATAAVAEHEAKTSNVHGATSAATVSTLMQRDAAGQAHVGAPTANTHIARKQDVDAIRSDSSKEFVLEVRTSDPVNPVVGRRWFRSDLS